MTMDRPVTDATDSADRDGDRGGPLETPRAVRRSAPSLFLQVLLIAIVPAVLLLIWQVGTASGWIPVKILPSPAAVGEAFVRLAGDGLAEHVLASLGRATAGLLAGGVTGFVLALATGLSIIGARLIDPTVQAIRTIPPLALLSLFILWFGIGEEPKITLIALGAAFPVYINTIGGIRSVDPRLLEAAAVYRVGPRERILRIIIPQALPSIFSGIRLATSISIMLLVAAEQIATRGLGFLLLQGQSYFDSAQVIVVILLYALLGVAADLVVRGIQYLSTPWTHRGANR